MNIDTSKESPSDTPAARAGTCSNTGIISSNSGRMTRMLRRALVVWVWCVCAIVPASNITLFAQTSQPIEILRTAIDQELTSPAFRRVLVAVEISSVRTDSILYTRNAELLLRPASNTKLFTSAAALLGLDDSLAFLTTISRLPIDSMDAWFVKGSGDPLMMPEDADRIASVIADSARRPIHSITFDAGIFDTAFYGPGWMWDDEATTDTPYLSAFPFNRNHLTISVGPEVDPEGYAVVRTDPDSPVITIVGRVASGRVNRASIRKRDRSNTFVIEGTLRPGQSISEEFSMWRPQDIFFDVVHRALRRRLGVDSLPPWRAGATPVDAHQVAGVGHRLSAVLDRVNKDSDNQCAEQVLKRLGTMECDRGASLNDGIITLRRLVATLGVDTNDVRLVDGSGLSYYNLVTARSLGTLLRGMYRSPMRERYKASLAVGAVDGTLKNRFAGMQNARSVLAKTGTLRSVTSLSGYVETGGEDALAFVILMQNLSGEHPRYRAIQDRIIQRCMEYLKQTGIRPLR